MNIKNRTLYIGDNLNILRNIDPEVIDLIYLDPPFNTKKYYKAPIDSRARGASFKDIWTDEDVQLEWYGEVAEQNQELYQVIRAAETLSDKSMKIYLMAMAIRLFEMYRILKNTGSIYLHCDPTASHYLKLIMDSIFGKENFRNEIVWKRTSAHSKPSNKYSSVHDIILFYSKGDNITYNQQYNNWDSEHEKNFTKKDDYKKYKLVSITMSGKIKNGESGKPWRGIDPTSENKHWIPPKQGAYADYVEKNFEPNYKSIEGTHARLDILDKNGLLYYPKSGALPKLKWYSDVSPGSQVSDTLIDINRAAGKERTGYPTQKPLALLDLIIKTSSNEDDIVLDPFCGCATACVAAEKLGRKWIGIDISDSAEVITKLRLEEEITNKSDFWDPIKDIIVTRILPTLTNPPKKQNLTTNLFDDPNKEKYSETELEAFRSHKHRMYGNQEGKCNGCLYPLPFRNMTIDHILPKSEGGSDELHNLQLLCGACNSTKSNNTQNDLIHRLKNQKVQSRN